MLGYTGTWQGHPVTIHGTGMGMPSLSIYVNELIRDYGAQTLIRIGSAGGDAAAVKVRDVVLAQTASTAVHPVAAHLPRGELCALAPISACCRRPGTRRRRRACRSMSGGIYSSDVFYDERPDLNDQLQRHGILCVEMEAAELYTLAARYGRRALAVLTISDHLLTHEALPADRPRAQLRRHGRDRALTAAFA